MFVVNIVTAVGTSWPRIVSLAVATLPCKEYLNQDRGTVSHAVHRILQSQQNKLLWKHRHIIIHPASMKLKYFQNVGVLVAKVVYRFNNC